MTLFVFEPPVAMNPSLLLLIWSWIAAGGIASKSKSPGEGHGEEELNSAPPPSTPPTLDSRCADPHPRRVTARAPELLRVSVVEDDERERRLLADLLRRAAGFDLVGVHATPESAWATLRAEAADVLLLDLVFDRSSLTGHDFLRRLAGETAPPKVVVWTVHDDEGHLFAALKAGAAGYLLKTTPLDHLPDALRAAYRGELRLSAGVARLMLREFASLPAPRSAEPDGHLTPRERTALELLAEGYSQGEIAAKLGLSLRTVETHLAAARRKLAARTTAQAAARYARGDR